LILPAQPVQPGTLPTGRQLFGWFPTTALLMSVTWCVLKIRCRCRPFASAPDGSTMLYAVTARAPGSRRVAERSITDQDDELGSTPRQ
jgi:hypothetical protein